MIKAVFQGYKQDRDPLVAMETQLVSLRQFKALFVLLALYNSRLTKSK